MTDPAVGKADQQVNISMVPGGGNRLVFVTASGKYLGSIQFDAPDPQSLSMLGNLFQRVIAQQTSGIQIAGAAALNGLRS